MYQIFRNNLGQVDAINAPRTGASLPLPLEENEDNPLVIELREWEKEHGALDLSSRIIDPLTLEQAKAQKKQEIIAIAMTKQEELVAGFAPPEQASWVRKVAESKSFLASGKIEDAPMLRVEAIALSGAKKDNVIYQYTQGLAARILQKSEQMYLESAEIAGKRSRLVAEVDKCETFELLSAVAWN